MRMRWRAAYRKWGHGRLIFAAVFALTINLATRYCVVADPGLSSTKTVKAQALDGERQRLLGDGLHWVAPAATGVLFEPQPMASRALPQVPAVTDLYSESCLHNRPPPAC